MAYLLQQDGGWSGGFLLSFLQGACLPCPRRRVAAMTLRTANANPLAGATKSAAGSPPVLDWFLGLFSYALAMSVCVCLLMNVTSERDELCIWKCQSLFELTFPHMLYLTDMLL